MKVRDVMTSDVVSVGPEASIDEAVQLMLQRRISGLRSRWIEFFTGPGKLASEYVQTSGRKVHQVMTTDVQTATEDTALEEIVRLMERRRIKRVPILRGKKLVGIVSRANLLRALANVAREVLPPRRCRRGTGRPG